MAILSSLNGILGTKEECTYHGRVRYFGIYYYAVMFLFFIIKLAEATCRGIVSGQALCRKTTIKQGENPV